MRLSLRAAGQDDVPLILEMIRELAQFENLEREVVADASTLAKSLFGTDPAAEVILADWKGAPAGFALFFPNFSTFLGKPGLYLEDLYVREPFRRNGIGRALLIHLAQIAKARDYGRMEWWVLDGNASAIRFYRSLGAEAMKDWTVFRLTGKSLLDLAQQPSSAGES